MTINAVICYFTIQMITSFYTLTRLINRGCRNPCQIDKGWLRILWHTDSHPCIQLSFNTNPNNEFSTCTCIYHNIHLYKINCKQRYTWQGWFYHSCRAAWRPQNNVCGPKKIVAKLKFPSKKTMSKSWFYKQK